MRESINTIQRINNTGFFAAGSTAFRCSPFFPVSGENGCNESFNGKLRDELLNGEIFYTLKEARVLIENWRQEYNTIRPHSSLGYRPPVPDAMMLSPATLHCAGPNIPWSAAPH